VPATDDDALPDWLRMSVAAAFGGALPATGNVLPVEGLAQTALEAAQRGAAVLLESVLDPPDDVATKSSDTDMVSAVDRASELVVTETIARLRPADSILGEEGSAREGTSGVRWVVDPLDGTTNYLFGIPAYSVSIAAEIADQPVVGVVIDPSRAETWAAARGCGAWRSGMRSYVAAGRSSLSTALVATGFGYRPERRAWQARVAATLIPAVRDIRRFGSAALDLCWVGGGRLDAYYEWGLNPWDLSAGTLVCEESGGRVGVLGDRTIVAAVPDLFDPLCELLVRAGALDAPEGPEPREW
jgi:myo-inositol-1(or 4)-monophosphatase